jgi:alcohol dehydrogenase (cytochrome c)
MKNTRNANRLILFLALVVGGTVVAFSQGLDRSTLLKPLSDSWPTYNGDYSGRRFSSLTQINSTNVNALSLAWNSHFSGGEGNVSIKATPLMVNGILYFSAPNNVWAVEAHTGRELWHYVYPPNTGSTIGNRGVGIYGNWLYFESPDSNLISLDARTGKERWKIQIVDPKLDYTSTAAPIVVGNHILVGIGGDHIDNPGFFESRDPETGDLQWKWNTTPRKGEPGMDTWPDEYASARGNGTTWIPGAYDPQLNLYYLGTGNPDPVMAEQSRKGDNLYTCSIVALNPDTGKMVWYFQVSPHDTHDWDATEPIVLIDGTINGQPRKLLAQASRNGYYFLLDRTNGKDIVTTPLIDSLNWAKGINKMGQPIPDPAKYPTPDGTLVSPPTGGATNWPPVSFDPQTGMLYVGTSRAWSEYYKTDTDDHPEGWGGVDSGTGSEGGSLLALDYKTGKVAWHHDWPGGGGAAAMLTTAGKLLFTSNSNYLIAFDPANGKILWHTGLVSGSTAGPITYTLDGKQYLLDVAGDNLYAFTVNKPAE